MKDEKLKFQLYDLRHLWGIQSAKTNLSTANAARAMGHSVALHKQTYLETFAKEDTKDVFKRKLLEDLIINSRSKIRALAPLKRFIQIDKK